MTNTMPKQKTNEPQKSNNPATSKTSMPSNINHTLDFNSNAKLTYEKRPTQNEQKKKPNAHSKSTIDHKSGEKNPEEKSTPTVSRIED